MCGAWVPSGCGVLSWVLLFSRGLAPAEVLRIKHLRPLMIIRKVVIVIKDSIYWEPTLFQALF